MTDDTPDAALARALKRAQEQAVGAASDFVDTMQGGNRSWSSRDVEIARHAGLGAAKYMAHVLGQQSAAQRGPARTQTGDFEPIGCPVPGACVSPCADGIDQHVKQIVAALGQQSASSRDVVVTDAMLQAGMLKRIVDWDATPDQIRDVIEAALRAAPRENAGGGSSHA